MALLFPLFAVLIWSINTVISKAAANVIDPAAISFYRWLVAGIVLTPFCIKNIWHNRSLIYHNWLKLLVLAFLGMVIFQCIAYYAAFFTSATNMAVINGLLPLMSSIMGILFFNGKGTIKTFFSIILSFTGVVIILCHGDILSLTQNGINRGDGFMLIAVLSYSLYGILLKRWQFGLTGWNYLYIQILFSIVLLIPVALQAHSLEVTAKAAGFILFAGIGSSLIAAFCWMQGLQKVGVEKTSIFMNLMPLFTAIIAIITLNEPVTSYHIIGGSMIISGVLITQINRKLLHNFYKHPNNS